MGEIRGDLLLAVLDNVTFDTETGCWELPDVFDAMAPDYRWLAWCLWHDQEMYMCIYLDQPWCAHSQYGSCINPVHSTNVGSYYTRLSRVDLAEAAKAC